MTGKDAGIRYTALVADDEGGGSVILPGPNGSRLATQDFGSTVVRRARQARYRPVVRRHARLPIARRMAATRRDRPGGGDANNRVFGPDFQWRFSGTDFVSGQYVYSTSRTPNRPDLADEWNGQRLSGHAADLQWGHSTTHLDAFADYRDISDGFRANNGFVPQVGVA